MDEANGVRVWASDLDPNALLQAERLSRCPVVKPPVALMADAHVGMGATIGSVIVTEDAIVPAAVGVDIGCGLMPCLNAPAPKLDARTLAIIVEEVAAFLAEVCVCGHARSEHRETMPRKLLCFGCLGENDNRAWIGCEYFMLELPQDAEIRAAAALELEVVQLTNADVAQAAEHLIRNEEVAGSIPAIGPTCPYCSATFAEQGAYLSHDIAQHLDERVRQADERLATRKGRR